MKNGKRILSVTIKHMLDDSQDTSLLGEYSNKRTSEYSIDRAHSLDCRVNTGEMPPNETTHNIDIAYARSCNGSCADCGANPDECLASPCEHYHPSEDCDCGDGRASSRELQFFNPSNNYTGEKPEDVRKYTIQDYARMERLNAGDWYFMGICAQAKIGIPNGAPCSFTIQRITSGGLWGIESDSETYYIESEEQNQLAELRKQLKALGFSSRAISKAFEMVERKNDCIA